MRLYDTGHEAATITPVAMAAYEPHPGPGWYLHRLNRDGNGARCWPVRYVEPGGDEHRSSGKHGYFIGDCEEQRAELDAVLVDAGHALEGQGAGG